MARPTYKDERRVLEALRHLRTGTRGKLPTREVLIDAFLGTSSNNPELVEKFRGVLRSEKKLSFAVLDRCLSKVNKDYEQGRLFLSNDLLRNSTLDGYEPNNAVISSPDYKDENSIMSDESVELHLLNLIHNAVFGTPMTEIGIMLLKRLSRSLVGLDPAAQVFLLAEFELRETLRIEYQLHPDAYSESADSIKNMVSVRDIELLLAAKLWTQQQEFSLPWDFLAQLGGSGIYTPLIRYMEPLDQPEWEPVLNWYLLALYSSQSSLEANRKNLKLELRLGVDLPIRWETILQLADKYWEEK